MTTYSNQDSLPTLPLPSLDETLDKYLNVVKAIADSKKAEEAVREFREGDGPRLQKLLEEYAKLHASYVEEFWSDAYLVPDDSVVLNLNPFFLLEDHPDAKVASSQIHRASSLVFASLKFVSMLKNETLPPDTFRGVPLCMDQFKAMFGSCRVPVQNCRDRVENYPASKHIVVLQRGQIFYFQALWDDGALAVTEDDIVEILKAIDKFSRKTRQRDASSNALGVLTTLSRSKWSLVRQKLVHSSEKNSNLLDVIDQALFVLALDDFSPRDINEAASNMLHGTYNLEVVDENDFEYLQSGSCINRWYDKLQLIVCRDGSAGVNFEHSSIDGHTALRFVSDIFADTVVSFAQSITKAIYGTAEKIPSVLNAVVRKSRSTLSAFEPDTNPRKLDFDLPLDILQDIKHAEVSIGDQICGLENIVLEFHGYGKSYIVSKKLSPDSFVQMSILLAYYRMYGNVVCSYEPVLTKRYIHGRTEAMRSTTTKVATLCKVFCSHFTTKQEKIDALIEAISFHSSCVRDCAAGKGVDRHLFALKNIAAKHNIDIPSFYSSESWNTMNHTIISTSNCGNPSLRLFGFGPVVPDGFGVGYIIKDSLIAYSISSKHRQTKRFVQVLRQTLHLVQDLLGVTKSLQVSNHTKGTISEVKEIKNNLEYLEGYGDTYGEGIPSLKISKSITRNLSMSSTGAPLANVTPRESMDALGSIGKQFAEE